MRFDCEESYLGRKNLSDSVCFLLTWELLGRLRVSHLLSWIVGHELIFIFIFKKIFWEFPSWRSG